jgi:hypothetical protein
MAHLRTKKRAWIGLILVVAACVGFYTGHTPLNFLVTGVGVNTFGTVDAQNFRLMVGQSIPFEACVSQSPISHACDASALTFRPRSPGDAPDTRVDEAGRFRLGYSRSARGFTIVVNPVRWGETGVLSYRVGDAGRLLRTLENRDPTEMDEHLSSGSGWEFGNGG